MPSIKVLRHHLSESSLCRRGWFRFSTLLSLLLLSSCSTSSSNTASSPSASPASPVATTSPEDNKATGVLATVQSRGKLICGTSGKVPGFSFVDPQGGYVGFDVDICRAIAVAIFNDPTKVEYRSLSTAQRFTSLQTNSIDVLSQAATITLSREASVGIDFAPVVLYDGQGIMVKQASGIKAVADLSNKSICVQTGTTTEKNLTDQMRKRNLQYKPIVFGDVNAALAAYQQGRCEAITIDRSGLVANRSKFPNPKEHIILDEVLSKEPLAPAVKQGDPQWSNLLRWVVYALIQADEFEINSTNVDQVAQSATDPGIKRFLGVEENISNGLGVSNDFARRIIKQIGNYSEIYDRHFGPKTPLNLERGQNKLWTKGGLLYSPPFR